MKKLFYYLMYLITIIAGISFLYELFTISRDSSVKTMLMLFFECITAGIITILMEDRPRVTEAQKRVAQRIENQGFGLLIVTIVTAAMLLFFSC